MSCRELRSALKAMCVFEWASRSLSANCSFAQGVFSPTLSRVLQLHPATNLCCCSLL